MDIVIIADFVGRLDDTDNNRFTYLAEMLLKKGHDVEIVTSDFNHGTKQFFEKKYAYNGIKITMIHEPRYRKNVCIKRFFAHYLWGKSVGIFLKRRKKPDVVYCAMPTLKAASVAGKYCNKHGIKFIIDVQDLWPEAYKMVFNIPIISSIVFLPFKILANSAYKRADEIVAVSKTYVDRALRVNKKVKEGHSVFLGTDLDVFDSFSKSGIPYEKKDQEIWLGYCGTLGASYDLKVVFDALRLLNNPKIKFVVMGDGPKYDEFKAYSTGLNVLFTGKLPYTDMCALLAKCDIAVNPIMHNAAQSIINKHADYAAAGLPIINTQESKEYQNLVSYYEMGFNCKNNDSVDLKNRIQILVDDIELRKRMSVNSRRCAEELFNRLNTYPAIINLLEVKNDSN